MPRTSQNIKSVRATSSCTDSSSSKPSGFSLLNTPKGSFINLPSESNPLSPENSSPNPSESHVSVAIEFLKAKSFTWKTLTSNSFSPFSETCTWFLKSPLPSSLQSSCFSSKVKGMVLSLYTGSWLHSYFKESWMAEWRIATRPSWD